MKLFTQILFTVLLSIIVLVSVFGISMTIVRREAECQYALDNR